MRRIYWGAALAVTALVMSCSLSAYFLLHPKQSVTQYHAAVNVGSEHLRTTHPRMPPVALFIGDSYAVGGFPKLTATQMEWFCQVDAEGGTGYLNDGHINSLDFKPYMHRLKADIAEYIPDYVIVSGGRNDGRSSSLGEASLAYFRAVMESFPKARLIVILPFWQNNEPPPDLLWARREIRKSAREVGAPTIDPDGWLNMSLIGPDGIHPTAKGQQAIANRLSQALSKLLAKKTLNSQEHSVT